MILKILSAVLSPEHTEKVRSDFMNIVEYLKMGKSLECETAALKCTLIEMEELCKMGNCDREVFLTYLSLKADVSSRLVRIMEIKRDILSLIGKIENPTYRTLLTLRYVKGFTMEKCAEMMDYEERHLYRLHKKAVDAAANAGM